MRAGMMVFNALNDLLKARQLRGLSQGWVATRIGICRESFNRLEGAHKGLSFDRACQWAEALGKKFILVPADFDVTQHITSREAA